jgi:hypothetical protein
LTVVVLPGCGEKRLPPPEFKAVSSKFKKRHFDGPNFLLACDVELRYRTGDHKLEIVETVADKSEVRNTFTGTGRARFTIQLPQTFVNDGESPQIEKLLEQLPTLVRWPASLSPGETATFLEYEGLDGIPVRYEMRLR